MFYRIATATTQIYTLSLHDALPISCRSAARAASPARTSSACCPRTTRDRKSTRLNSSHTVTSYAVFCLKKNTVSYTELATMMERFARDVKLVYFMRKSTVKSRQDQG